MDEEVHELDLWELCEELFFAAECDESGCYSGDDALDGMCSDIWWQLWDEMGGDEIFLYDDEDEEDC